ncbi:MAG: AI-2E family transporter [Gammaproteobacteria bacterium]
MKPANIAVFVVAAALLLWLLQAAGGALAPFILAAVLAYILSPLAGKLENTVSPAASAALLVALILALLLALPLALAPIIVQQTANLLDILPEIAARAGDFLGKAKPLVVEQLRHLDFAALAERAAGAIQAEQAADAAGTVFGFFGKGISAVAGFFSLLLVTPLAAFYFLRDRHAIAGELADSLPPRWRDETMEVVHDLDGVLGEFLHGQLAVMAVMGVLYSAMLWFAGLEYALTIGVISGALAFIPYVGFIIGVTLATLAAAGQFESWSDFILIWALMGAGTTLESMLITPWLVGERIGLHPVMVLFALLALGSLLGFVGVLAALPLSAAALVLFRHLRRRYINSAFYGRTP